MGALTLRPLALAIPGFCLPFTWRSWRAVAAPCTRGGAVGHDRPAREVAQTIVGDAQSRSRIPPPWRAYSGTT
jgi:hypothetical protein